MDKVRVSLAGAGKDRSYDIRIGAGVLDSIGRMTREIFSGHLMIVTDPTTHELFFDKVRESYEDAGFHLHSYVLPGGERAKNLGTCAGLLNAMAQAGLKRDDGAVALGGGVTGDITGFAAAAYLRGIAYFQAPTTVLSAIDSSVGGKTGVNLPAGKNLAGAFHQPRGVFVDTNTFLTLDGHACADGLSEAVKYGMIRDRELFESLNYNSFKAKSGEGGDALDTPEGVIKRCVSIKADIVAADERDHGERQLLNFGHTVGHAIEKLSGYAITHGHAVAMGMMTITRAAERLGIFEGSSKPLFDKLKSLSLPTETPYSKSELKKAAMMDKKGSGGGINIVVPKDIGRCVLLSIDFSELEDFFGAGLKQL